METTWNAAAVTLHPASPAEIAEVLDVLNEAAAWLRGKGVTQWPDHFESAWVEGAIDRGETWLARAGATTVGTITLSWSDPLWTDIDGVAGYVHRVAVRRHAAGLGALLLDWAAATTRRNGRHLLRLDCVATNSRLRTYYETRGFTHQGDILEGGTRVSRYELALPHEYNG